MLQGLRNIGQAREEAHHVSDGAVQQSVGDMLRARREEYGLDLRDVSKALHIRHPYLMAIEEGRLDDLPGATYAIGFVRAYADHLRLDGPAVVERYKDETAALANAAQLVFPSPLPEGKVPSGKILLIAVLALAVIYGGWLLTSLDGQRLAELVPALPDRFLALIGVDEASSNAPDVTPPAAAKESSEEIPAAETTRDLAAVRPETQDPPPPLPSVDVEAASPMQPPATPPMTQESDGAASDDVQSIGVAPEPEVSAEKKANGQVAGAEASETPSPDTPASERPTVEGTASGNIVAALDPAPPAPPAAPSESAKKPRQYGAENTDARVIIRATDDSWVQVRDKEGKLLLTRVLRIGDSYRVPNDTGVVMRTGNAGGLDIQVDGETVPGLGPKGAIRHEVALDAERLKAGTAIIR